MIWNRFRPECLDIDGELPMECIDSGMVMLKENPGAAQTYGYGAEQFERSVLRAVLRNAYQGEDVSIVQLCKGE